MNTIFALSSAPGKAGVSIIRVSGPDALKAGQALVADLPPPRRAATRMIRAGDGGILDQALVLTFAAGHSFTGEDTVEFHLHGSTAIVGAVLKTLGDITGLRPAEPGGFTRQALENQRLDLTQVEGLADLIDAETEAQRRQAMKVLSGALGDKAAGWRRDLVRAAALLEATIDFVDEDVPVDVAPEVLDLIGQVSTSLRHEARGAEVAERIRDGFEVAIVGPPNAGKSTLLNALAGREAAITSEFAGTTRDVIEVQMELRGLPVTILDTAGLRDAADAVEAIGIQRATERAIAADLRIFLDDGTVFSGLSLVSDDIRVFCKADLRDDKAGSVSGKTGQGLQELVDRITDTLEKRSAGAATATRARHRLAIEQAIQSLARARSEVKLGSERTEIAAEELHRAILSLDSLVGLVDVEHILGEIFASFCVGK